MNLDTYGLKLGDRVLSRTLGVSVPATVIGFIAGEIAPSSTRWDELYPEWREKLIVYCKFDTPQKTVTLDEFEEQLPEHDTFLQAIKDDRNLLNAYYNKILPDVEIVNYPIEDLI